MSFLSKTCIYGIRAAIYLTSFEHQNSYVGIRQVSEDLHLSFHFLTKIFQTLTNHNIIISYRGPNGGVSLAKPANEITIMDIIVAIEGEELFTGCLLALPGCGEELPCPLHHSWSEMRENMKSNFENTSLKELADRMTTEGLRLASTINST